MDFSLAPSLRCLRVGILGFDGVHALDLVGPLEALAEVRISGTIAYDVKVVGLMGSRFRSESGVTFEAHHTIFDEVAYDTIIVPGGAGLRESEALETAQTWIRRQARTARRIVSVCTGAYALAAAGLLDGRRATTHWRFITDLSHRYPAISIEPDAIFVKDGPIYTSAGIAAGIDLALALIEDDHGPQAALAVAREMVVFLKRPGGQAQFSEPLAMQTRAGDRFVDLIAWMGSNLREDQTVDVLAARTGMSARHFSRHFTSRFSETPARYVEGLRIAAARGRLESGREAISTIAIDVGFRSDDAFARAFQRRLGVRPIDYRRRFQTEAVRKSLSGQTRQSPTA